MLVQLCVILRMVLNEDHQLSLDRYGIVPCDEGSKETAIDNSLKDFNDPLRDGLLDTKLNYMWNRNPMDSILEPRPESYWSRPAIFRKPSLSLTKLSKSIQNDFSPSFRKSDFEFERRNKPITLLAFRNAKIWPAQQKAMSKTYGESNSGEVAELQSPYNGVSAFWQDERNG